jgi:hypothetical protein
MCPTPLPTRLAAALHGTACACTVSHTHPFLGSHSQDEGEEKRRNVSCNLRLCCVVGKVSREEGSKGVL